MTSYQINMEQNKFGFILNFGLFLILILNYIKINNNIIILLTITYKYPFETFETCWILR